MATPMRITNAGNLPNPLNSTLIVYSVSESYLKNSLQPESFQVPYIQEQIPSFLLPD